MFIQYKILRDKLEKPSWFNPKERPKSADLYILLKSLQRRYLLNTQYSTSGSEDKVLAKLKYHKMTLLDDGGRYMAGARKSTSNDFTIVLIGHLVEYWNMLPNQSFKTQLYYTVRGTIVPNVSKIPAGVKSVPVTCTHTAEDRTAKVWDLHSGKEIISLSGHPNNVISVKYCPTSRLVFTVSQSYINVWDIRNRTSSQCVKTLSSSGLTHDGPISFAPSRQIELPPGEHHINDIALNKDGTVMYSATGSVVRVWDLKSFSAIGKLNGGHQAAVMVLAVNRENDNDIVVTGSKDHYIKLFEVLEERAGILTPKYNLAPPHYDGIQSLAIQGSTLFSGSRDTCIKKWDLSTQKLKQSVNSAHKDWICALDFMPSSNILLSGCRAGYLKLWNTDNCQSMGDVRAHASPINDIATNSTSIFTASNEPALDPVNMDSKYTYDGIKQKLATCENMHL
ncbi:hypothetical protein KUTeg_023318 [Tegillarca granosa]|uniref:Uncharacterized protein n=1 Tax=Tegillarca granosa TaxID=220873 RepID=A0ABQ9E199_TEGGR|nr:hypothetical protein KUTeg_023318 [Tegillarca granosa]